MNMAVFGGNSMRKLIANTFAAALLATTWTPVAAAAPSVDFGDDTSKYARDGECDDKRFSGPGMTETALLDSDIKHDATDCRAAYRQGRLQLRQ
jgi:hypothetical protein